MLPLFAVVKIAPRHGRAFRLWLPLFLVWMLLVVLGLILSPLIIIACLIVRLNPFKVVWGLMNLFAAMAGTDIEIQSPEADVIVRVI